MPANLPFLPPVYSDQAARPAVTFYLLDPATGARHRFRFHVTGRGPARRRFAAHVVAVTFEALAAGRWPPHFARPAVDAARPWLAWWLGQAQAAPADPPPAPPAVDLADEKKACGHHIRPQAPNMKKHPSDDAQDLPGAVPGMAGGAAPAIPSVAQALDHALAIKAGRVSEKTMRGYRTVAGRLVEHAHMQGMAARPWTEYTAAQARGFLRWVMETHTVTARTRNNYLSWARALWEVVTQECLSGPATSPGSIPPGSPPQNPFSGLGTLRAAAPGRDVWTDAELAAVAARLRAQDPGLWVYCQLVYYCFLRPVEICRLRVRDVRLADGVVLVPAESAKSRGRVAVIPAPLSAGLRPFLDGGARSAQEGQRADWFLFHGPDCPRPGPGQGSRAVLPIRYAERFARHRAALGLRSSLKVYGLKDTGAYRARLAGLDVKDISEQMGHASLNETDHYLRPITSSGGRRFAERIPALP